MGYSLTISSIDAEFNEVAALVHSFLDTYGDCSMTIYEVDTLIEEDGIVIHGEYGVLDKLLSLLQDKRLTHLGNPEDARFMLKWNLVIYALDQTV